MRSFPPHRIAPLENGLLRLRCFGSDGHVLPSTGASFDWDQVLVLERFGCGVEVERIVISCRHVAKHRPLVSVVARGLRWEDEGLLGRCWRCALPVAQLLPNWSRGRFARNAVLVFLLHVLGDGYFRLDHLTVFDGRGLGCCFVLAQGHFGYPFCCLGAVFGLCDQCYADDRSDCSQMTMVRPLPTNN